jgi:nitroreductase
LSVQRGEVATNHGYRETTVNKSAETDYPIHELIQKRWSPRAFSDQNVPKEVLQSLFEAARWAPSSNNEQPWAFLVAAKEDAESHAKALSTLVEFNQAWAKHAPVLVIAVSEMAFRKNGTPNRNAFYDTGAAVAHLTAEATSRGLFVHQMAGFDPKKAKELFAIPEGWEPIAAFTIGYVGDPQSLSDVLREREQAPRTRKPISDFVMAGQWGQTAAFAKKSS